MNENQLSIYWLVLKLFLLTLFLAPFLQTALAVDELLSSYSAPQALSMGNALSADAKGYLANYYNPAGLAKMRRKKIELHVPDVQLIGSTEGLSHLVGERSFGTTSQLASLQTNSNRYSYKRFNALSSFAVRGFGATFLTSYEFAGQSDGTTADVSTRLDVGFTAGIARNFAGNLVKLGVVGKILLRNELAGEFAHTSVSNAQAVKQNSQEGVGFGADAGFLLTLPYAALPSFAIVIKDVFDTNFQSVRLLNSSATGAPARIAQSVNAAFSLHPAFTHFWRTILAIEVKHLERTDLILRKQLHLGLQINYKEQFFILAGLNQGFWTAGLGLHVPLGEITVGSYAQDVGAGSTVEENRRYFLRLTITL